MLVAKMGVSRNRREGTFSNRKCTLFESGGRETWGLSPGNKRLHLDQDVTFCSGTEFSWVLLRGGLVLEQNLCVGEERVDPLNHGNDASQAAALLRCDLGTIVEQRAYRAERPCPWQTSSWEERKVCNRPDMDVDEHASQGSRFSRNFRCAADIPVVSNCSACLGAFWIANPPRGPQQRDGPCESQLTGIREVCEPTSGVWFADIQRCAISFGVIAIVLGKV